jgi:hypothetical protein
MKESKLVELKNRVEGLTKVVREIVKEVQTNASLAQGTLTAFQYHIGKEKWDALIAELQDKEKKMIDEQKQKSPNFTGPKLEVPKDK